MTNFDRNKPDLGEINHALIKSQHFTSSLNRAWNGSQHSISTSSTLKSLAFDSVDREVIWKLLRYYGVPLKIIHLIQQLYENAACQVIHSGKLTEPIEVKTGVR